ncbi:hypothetical protein [Kitasatospora herbaricolor]|uniref:Uncharacterized protein n=1 Tax=Kitasatospora herbaricolor TaxID=68217 RepID=A0ABZ1W005_9ACTN|nr:hypothetical protein [Kitasatospora herbaricolor]
MTRAPGPVTAGAIGLGLDTMLRPNPREPAAFTIENLTDDQVVGTADHLDLDPQRAVRAFTRPGFREEGRRRSAVPVQGRRYDRVLLGPLREEWVRPA